MVNIKDIDEIKKNLNFLKIVTINIKDLILKISTAENEIYSDVKTSLSNTFNRLKLEETSLEKLKSNHNQINIKCDNIINLVTIELTSFNNIKLEINKDTKTEVITIDNEHKENLKTIYSTWSNLGKLLGKDLNYLFTEISAEGNYLSIIEKYEIFFKELKNKDNYLIKLFDKYIYEKSNGNLEFHSKYIKFEYIIVKYFIDNKDKIKFTGKPLYNHKFEIAKIIFDYLIKTGINYDEKIINNYISQILMKGNLFSSNNKNSSNEDKNSSKLVKIFSSNSNFDFIIQDLETKVELGKTSKSSKQVNLKINNIKNGLLVILLDLPNTNHIQFEATFELLKNIMGNTNEIDLVKLYENVKNDNFKKDTIKSYEVTDDDRIPFNKNNRQNISSSWNYNELKKNKLNGKSSNNRYNK